MNQYIFQAQPAKNAAGVIPPKIEIVLRMPQEQFEDFGYVRSTLHAEFIRLGYKLSEIIQWRQTPKVSQALIRKLKKAINCRSDALFRPQYADRYRHSRYHKVVIDGKNYRYMDFDGGQLIKFAPALPES